MPIDIRHFPGLEMAALCLIGLYSEVISIAFCRSMGNAESCVEGCQDRGFAILPCGCGIAG